MRVLPDTLRMQLLRARVSRYQIVMLQYMAEQESTTARAVLTRELEDVTYARADEFPHTNQGFAAALESPFGDGVHHVC